MTGVMTLSAVFSIWSAAWLNGPQSFVDLRHGLTRSLAHAFGTAGVRVNAIAPGYHRTNMTRPLWDDPLSANKIAARSALKRWGEVDDLVGAVLFLASPAAAFITGTTLPVDGGYATGV